MKFASSVLSLALFCCSTALVQAQDGKSLLEIRGDFKTKIIAPEERQDKSPAPPADSGLKLVKYKTELGEMNAYISAPPESGRIVPAIIWLTGGFPVSSPGSFLWEQPTLDNEQSSRIYRYKGVAMMFPTVRGANSENPGKSEQFYGEVNDVISAYDYLASLPYVDASRIYLGGHSTGGTLALLVAESTYKFKGVISLGPTSDDYGQENAIYEWTDKERQLRHPVRYLSSIKIPTYIIEGEKGNLAALLEFKKANKNPNVHVSAVKGATHFNCIHPVNSIIAQAILNSNDGNLTLSTEQIEDSYLQFTKRERETSDLETLIEERNNDVDFNKEQTLIYFLMTAKDTDLKAMPESFQKLGFTNFTSQLKPVQGGEEFLLITVERKLSLLDLSKVFAASEACEAIGNEHECDFEFWQVKKL